MNPTSSSGSSRVPSPTPGRPAECRAFLSQLAELADAPAGAAAGDHATTCRDCARHVAAARANVLLLRGLPTLTLPASERVLAGVDERVTRDAERHLGDLLRRSLEPVSPPEELTSGGLDEGSSPLASGLPRALPRPRTPAWLRTRVRADVQEHRRRGLRARRWRVAAVAAAFLLSLGVLGGLVGPRILGPSGTEGGVQFVFVTLDSAPDLELSPTGVVRLLGREVR